jgi:flagellin-like protein
MMKQRSKKAVSPVLATLMMVAVAVALSVIIFTWSQGFLSQTGEAASGQQAAQNIAAQSGLLIEAVTTTTSADDTNGTATIYLRNVGSVSFELGSLTLTGRLGNSGFNKTISIAQLNASNNNKFYVDSAKTKYLSIIAPSSLSLSKGAAATITVNFADETYPPEFKGYLLLTGDVFTVKVTTKAGTFAQATYTVP